MKINKPAVISGIVCALLGALTANTVRDYSYIHNNGKIMNKVSAVAKVITDYSIYNPDADKMSDAAAWAMTATIDDPYTRYFDKDSYRSYVDTTSSSYYGIGVTLRVDAENNRQIIDDVTKDGPGAAAGVLAGDVLAGVDDIICTAENMQDTVSYIKGKKDGGSVTLHILRGAESLDIAVIPSAVQNVLVESSMLSDGIGYMKIKNFERSDVENSRTAYDDFKDNISTLRDSGMTKLIIDLRDNPGGDLGVVSAIADEFLSEGVITYTEDKNGKKEYIYAQSGGMDFPTAIITNGQSASASEVLTAALHDNGKAITVGEKTFGKGIVQRLYPFGDGSGMSVTIAKYYTPYDVCIQGIGIEPDIECVLPAGTTKADYDTSTDPQILKAVEALQK
mgnify:FL=1